MDTSETLIRIESTLHDLTHTAEGIAVDADAGDPDGDVTHRAGTLQAALKSLKRDVQAVRRDLED